MGKLITILTGQRTGSNLCQEIIRSSGANVLGEFFAFKEGGGFRDKKCKEKDDPIKHLKERIKKDNKDLNVLRVMDGHFNPYGRNEKFKKVLSIVEYSDYVIILNRNSLLDQYASFLFANQNDVWIKYQESSLLSKVVSHGFKKVEKKPTFNSGSFERYKNNIQKSQYLYKTAVRGARNLNIINYEGILNNNLNIDYIIPEEWKLGLKVNKDYKIPLKISKNIPIWEKFTNPEDVKNYISWNY